MEDKLIREILNEYFIDYKQAHLIIVTVSTVLIAIIQIVQSMLISNKIEKFKSDLKKSEIRFTKFSELQIVALSKIYPILYDFKTATLEIKKSKNSSLNLYIINAQKWIKIYDVCVSEFSKNKYILPEKIKKSISSILYEFKVFGKLIYHEKEMKKMFYEDEFGEVHLGADMEDYAEISEKLKKFDRDGVISKTLKNIDILETDIEEYFKKY